MPSISGPSITSMGFSESRRASSVSSIIKSVIPCTNACPSLSETSFFRHLKSPAFLLTTPFASPAMAIRQSVASSRRLRMTSSVLFRRSSSNSEYIANCPALTIPMSIPALTAWYKKTACRASLTALLPRKEKETLLTPPLTKACGNSFFM